MTFLEIFFKTPSFRNTCGKVPEGSEWFFFFCLFSLKVSPTTTHLFTDQCTIIIRRDRHKRMLCAHFCTYLLSGEFAVYFGLGHILPGQVGLFHGSQWGGTAPGSVSGSYPEKFEEKAQVDLSNINDKQSWWLRVGTYPLFHDVIGMIGHLLHYCQGVCVKWMKSPVIPW